MLIQEIEDENGGGSTSHNLHEEEEETPYKDGERTFG
jgi:hypothetical protein